MFTLRLTQHAGSQPDNYLVQVEFTGKGLIRQTASARFQFALSGQDRENLRWYLEDYLQYPFDPAPKTAARVEKRMAEIGTELFRALFHADDDARDLWASLRARLNDTRVEIITGVREATSIPWELMRDPKTDTPLALRARAFVRTQPQPAQRPQLPQTESGPIRILLVICRPRGGEDVAFRSVATRLIKGLTEEARQALQLDVLRPPTFEQLGRVLRQAKASGRPYHVVHFDGHGTYREGRRARWRFSPLLFGDNRPGKHGYLVFENAALKDNREWVDGPALGKLLAETDTPVLVLNACLSAHAEAPDTPESVGANGHSPLRDDVHTQVRAFGSLAQEVMDAGAAGVVAMRYSVYVVTAAQFVADLYAALAQGHTLGAAVTLGRKQLHDQPLRTIAYDPRPLQDWSVPVVYEAASISLFPQPGRVEPGRVQDSPLRIILRAGDAAPERGRLDPSLPPRPDVGFFGRDETLLALDRAFDTQSVVLLHAYAGSGKTATAAEFARWYALTGGVEGPVLFTSLEQYKPLARVLDQIGRVFAPALEAAGVNWLAKSDAQRRDVALHVLKQKPVLWIWDNVEPVAGFPAGTKSAWSGAEQRELVDFLRAARETRARFLLTSRRDERAWLGELPSRITIPPMPMLEQVQLTRALAEKHGSFGSAQGRRRLTEVEDWRPLLRFTRGNPLTITVLVGQALRDGLTTKTQIEAFVAQLRAGEATFEDEASEGRSKSLGASLSYGFEHAFAEVEGKQLALLHFFQGFVDVDALRYMGHPKIGNLPELRGLTRESGIALLDRAAEVGLLTGLGSGFYSIHPALPWYFKSLFDQYYLQYPMSNIQSPTRAFVEAMGELGNHYANQYVAGNREVIGVLTAEEANLLHAWQLARRHAWWDALTSTMQGLRVLYDHTGRRAEWARLVEEIVPDFVDPTSDGPLPGREEQWGFVTGYRVRLARQARQWAEAERLQRVCVDWNRERATPALAAPPEALDDAPRNAIRTLAVSLEQLGSILREQDKPECVAAYEQAIPLCQRIGDRPEEAILAFNLGHAYMDLPAIRDLAQAERWYRRDLELEDPRDHLGRAKTLGQLGLVARERFKEVREANKPEEELLRHLNAAAGFYHQALDLLPPNAVDDLAVTHGQLGNIYQDAGDLNRALPHYREAIRYDEAGSNMYEAGKHRFNVALALRDAGSLADAREYAHAALRNFQTYGDRAAAEIQWTQEFIAKVEQAMGL